MEIILLEKIRNLGDLGDQVTVKPGYGRNYLIPQGKAVRASKENQQQFAHHHPQGALDALGHAQGHRQRHAHARRQRDQKERRHEHRQQ